MDAITTVSAASLLLIARGIAAGLVIFLLLWAFDRRASLSAPGRLILGLSAAALGLLGLAYCAYRIGTNFVAPRDWDFLCFWGFGRALALGQSPYVLSVLQKIAEPQSPSAEFQSLNYCNYPPICLPVFWPLGYLSFPAAMATWYAVQVGALTASIVMLWHFWDVSKSWLGWLVTVAIVLTWHSTQSTLFYAQSTCILLLAILLAIRSPSPTWRGIWMGLGIVIKPIAAILLIDLVLRRQWRSLLACLAPPLVALGLFLLAQGSAGLAAYRHHNPVAGSVVFSFYVEQFNISLLAVLLRLFESAPLAQPIFFPPFVLSLGLLTAITLVVLIRLPRHLASLGIGYVVTLALLAYPGTLRHYSILLLIPAALVWQKRSSLPGGPMAAAAIVATAYGLIWGQSNFVAHLVVWTAISVLLTMASSTGALAVESALPDAERALALQSVPDHGP